MQAYACGNLLIKLLKETNLGVAQVFFSQLNETLFKTFSLSKRPDFLSQFWKLPEGQKLSTVGNIIVA